MKILYYSAHPTLSLNAQTGPGTHMREIINAMRELGHEVHPVVMADRIGIAAQSSSNTMQKRGLKTFVKSVVPSVIWRSLKELGLMRFDRKAKKILRQEIDAFGPDLVYERAAYLQLSGLQAAKEKKCLHYMEINAPFMDEVRKFEKVPTLWNYKARATEYMQTNAPDKVYVVSSVLKEYYMKYLKGDDKIRVVPNCVNMRKAVSNSELKQSIIETYNLHHKTIIGFVGSIFPYHGIDLLIRAFVTTARERPDTVLMIVGDGETIPELKALSRELNIEDRIIFTGSVPNKDVFSYIDLMDIAVMVKSNWYGSPVKIFEYGAMNKPIIAPLTSPVLDVMEKDVDALLTTPDEHSIAKAMNSLVSDKKLRNLIARKFHRKVSEQYTWTHAAKYILS